MWLSWTRSMKTSKSVLKRTGLSSFQPISSFLTTGAAQCHDNEYIIEMDNGNDTIKLFIAVAMDVLLSLTYSSFVISIYFFNIFSIIPHNINYL